MYKKSGRKFPVAGPGFSPSISEGVSPLFRKRLSRRFPGQWIFIAVRNAYPWLYSEGLLARSAELLAQIRNTTVYHLIINHYVIDLRTAPSTPFVRNPHGHVTKLDILTTASYQLYAQRHAHQSIW